MEIAAFCVAAIAALFAGWAVWYARSSAKAAVESAEAARVSAKAAETAERLQLEAEDRALVEWEFSIDRHGRAFMKNVGTSTAENVKVEFSGGYAFDEPMTRTTFPPGTFEQFMISRDFDNEADRVFIIWSAPPGRTPSVRSEEFPIWP